MTAPDSQLSTQRLHQLRLALQADPARAEHWQAYLNALIASGGVDEARALLTVAARRGLDQGMIDALAQRLSALPAAGAELAAHKEEPEQMETVLALFKASRFAEMEQAALQLIEQFPNDPSSWTLLGIALKRLGRPADAVGPQRRAVELAPEKAEAHCNLGATLNALGNLQQSEQALQRAVELNPQFAEAHYNLGKTLHDQARLADAAQSYRQAATIRPEYAKAHFSLAVTLQALKQPEEAKDAYRAAVLADAGYVDALTALAAMEQDEGNFSEATSLLSKALTFDPANIKALGGMGIALQALGRTKEAIAYFSQALALDPDDFPVRANLATSLCDLDQLEAAEKQCRAAVALRSDSAEALSNLANIVRARGRLEEACSIAQDAISLAPGYATAHYMHGVTLEAMGRIDEAIASYRRAVDLNPEYVDAQGNLLFAMNYHPDDSAEQIYQEYAVYDSRFGSALKGQWPSHSNTPHHGRRLRIGYVSPDFKQHVVGYFLEPLLASHDHSRVEVFAYAELASEDATTARYRGYCDHFTLTRGMSNEALAARIRADGIDVLVDVAGHTAHNRLLVFARKPAPVSLSWMGYGYSTGLKAIDYFLIDEASAPPGSEHLFSETPWRLPCAYAFRPGPSMGEVSALPALSTGRVTFGTLTRSIRINHRTIRVWSEILKRMPGAVLVIDSHSFSQDSMQEAMVRRFAERGIAPEQLQIGCHSPPWDTLRAMDIAVDCFPHNSGTTLFESLYMGVPFITLAGRPSVGRLGRTVLTGLGRQDWLDAWCADSEEDYIAKAVALASNTPALARIRQELRPTMQQSALMDEVGFARNVEQAYEQMFARWQATQVVEAQA